MAMNAKAITGPTVYASTTAPAKTPATATLDQDGGHPPKKIMRQRGYLCLAMIVPMHFCFCARSSSRMHAKCRSAG